MLLVLVGLQVRPVLERIHLSPGFLVAAAAVTIAAVVLTRLLALAAAGGLASNARERGVIAWSGMRGAVSLAAALSVPLAAPGRPLIIFLTFAVILATLVGQGLTLPAVVRRLTPEDTESTEEAEEQARIAAARAALERLAELEAEHELPPEAVDLARRRYELRLGHLEDGERRDETMPAARDVQRQLAATERQTIERLHADGELDQATSRRLERELDLQDERWSELEESPLS